MQISIKKVITVAMSEDEAREMLQSMEKDDWIAIEPLSRFYTRLADAIEEIDDPAKMSKPVTRPFAETPKRRKRKGKSVKTGKKARSTSDTVFCPVAGCGKEMKPKGLGPHMARKHPVGAITNALAAA